MQLVRVGLIRWGGTGLPHQAVELRGSPSPQNREARRGGGHSVVITNVGKRELSDSAIASEIHESLREQNCALGMKGGY